eukprot:COSAG06_NODE_45423_length_355_cov_0.589844_1_plen_34_part_01
MPVEQTQLGGRRASVGGVVGVRAGATPRMRIAPG